MNSPALFDPMARANWGAIAFFVTLEEIRKKTRAIGGTLCCVSVLTRRLEGRQTVQLTRSAPVRTKREVADLFATLPPGTIVAWFQEG